MEIEDDTEFGGTSLDDVTFLNMSLHAEIVRRWKAQRECGTSDDDIEVGVRWMLSSLLIVNPWLIPQAEQLIAMLRADATAS